MEGKFQVKKIIHEIRDPIHNFITLNNDERTILNSRPVQRLRSIHQLALTYQVYPGASHKRFEHSLGVMELATRTFNVVTNSQNITDKVREHFPELKDRKALDYWRQVLRYAALCHDIGHLPFSHAAEDKLLKSNTKHEHFTMDLIKNGEIGEMLSSFVPPINPIHVLQLAVGMKFANDIEFTNWERMLSNLIIDNNFGADRMDYLLRDSHHIGVAYGKFDHYRLIDCLRFLVPDEADNADSNVAPELGIEQGGIHAVEALNLARYYMYKQVYLHAVRRIYDIHLTDFLVDWLPNKCISNSAELLELTDNEIIVALHKKLESEDKFRKHADRILNRTHFKVVYSPAWNAEKIREGGTANMFERLCEQFPRDMLKLDHFIERSLVKDFPVLVNSDKIVSSVSLSELVNKPLVAAVSRIYAGRAISDEVTSWVNNEANKNATN